MVVTAKEEMRNKNIKNPVGIFNFHLTKTELNNAQMYVWRNSHKLVHMCAYFYILCVNLLLVCTLYACMYA